jgi:hypothetical protein
MRSLKWLAAASIAATASACSVPALAAPSEEQQRFCYMTAQVAMAAHRLVDAGATLPQLLESTQEALESTEATNLTQHQKAAVVRAVRFGATSVLYMTPMEVAKFQFTGCLATEV